LGSYSPLTGATGLNAGFLLFCRGSPRSLQGAAMGKPYFLASICMLNSALKPATEMLQKVEAEL
jgi:hypothetical protein